jgi:hypothetical protein
MENLSQQTGNGKRAAYKKYWVPPPPPPPYNYWRDKWLYVGVSALYNAQAVIDNADGKWWPTSPVSFTGAVSVEGQFLDFLSVEWALRPNVLFIEPKTNLGGPRSSLTVPITLRYVIKPGEAWMIEPYAGAAINIPFSEKMTLPAMAILAGTQVGARMGRLGAIFFTIEFDYETNVTYRFGTNESHTGPRLQLFFGMGAKFGFFNRKVKSDET